MGKYKPVKRVKTKSHRRGLSRFFWPGVILGIVASIAIFCTFQLSESASSNYPSQLKVAIIDQLCTVEPNEAFISEVTKELEGYGFEVDVYQGDDITVNFYRKLPTYGYKLIVFRVHSGSLVGEDVANTTWLFTGEPYSKTRHVIEQLTDQVTYAATHEGAPYVFAISPKFVAQGIEGQFAGTAIIMMGCSCLVRKDLAEAFIEMGASTYIAWNLSVHLHYVDGATTVLLEKLCSQELTVAKAVAETMEEKGPDPEHGAVLKYYPAQTGDKTLGQLIE